MNSTTRLVPLWIIFVFSLTLTFTSVQQLAKSITPGKSPDYSTAMNNYNTMGMAPGNYNNYCLTMPMYPMLSNSMMPESAPMSQDDKLALEKYNKELEKYNSDYMVACKEDVAKQEKLRQQKERFYLTSDVYVYAILLLLGIFSSIISFMVIRKAEEK